MQEHRSFPSIVQWVVFNEGWGQHDTLQVVQYAQSLDASRLFDPASGWVDCEVGNVLTLRCAASNRILAVQSRGLRLLPELHGLLTFSGRRAPSSNPGNAPGVDRHARTGRVI